MTTYRYNWKGLDVPAIQQSINPSLVPVVAGPAPSSVVDVTIGSSTAEDKSDLDAAMLQQGWIYASTDPPQQPQGIVLRQEIGVKLLVDSTTNSTTFVDLITVAITTQAGVLGLVANATSLALVTLGYLRITVDGVTVQGGAHLIGLANNFMGLRVPIAAGAHTVKLQWRTDAGGTHQINAASAPEAEFANLLVREMSS